ncbi:MAG TPA: small multi-drug export protein, partial [Candidatus Thermoplasmatota archaeon]|nr:small multi-drug export protein [Candidatus Thermoplasmatota archaeon]
QPRVQIALLKLMIPFALAGLFVFFILEVFGEAVANKLAAVFVLYFFNPVGKEVGIPFAIQDGPGPFFVPPAIDPALAWTFIVFIDVCTALFFVWNYDHVLRVPYIGRFLAWVERRGNAVVVKRKWIRRLAFFGLVIYATLPLEGTGAIGGSVVGRAIGLPAAKTFLAVATGSMVRTTITTLVVLGALSALGL